MNILTIDYNDKNIGEKFSESLHNSGFAVIKNHPIEQKLINKVYNDWKKFFNSNEKEKYLYDYEKQDGYFPFKSESAKDSHIPDLKESLPDNTRGKVTRRAFVELRNDVF